MVKGGKRMVGQWQVPDQSNRLIAQWLNEVGRMRVDTQNLCNRFLHQDQVPFGIQSGEIAGTKEYVREARELALKLIVAMAKLEKAVTDGLTGGHTASAENRFTVVRALEKIQPTVT